VTRREPERRVRTESFALVGTLSHEKGRYAFFDGSSSQYKKVIEPSGAIAGYTVAEIAPNHVTLQATNGQEIELRVGMQLQRPEDDGEWQLSARTETAEDSASSSRSTESSPSSGGGADDALKRLLQKREQEFSNAPAAPRTEPAPAPETKAETTSAGEQDEVLKRLMQRREQEK
jgi:hypothetical protein